MRLKGLDLNLLIALDILLEECSVSRSAERLYLSQPAASAALGRLREYFKDELLVLHGKRMIPTSYAQGLIPDVKRILSQVDDLISMSAEFDPSRSERLFRVMGSDYITTVLLSEVSARINELAPGIRLDVRLSEDAVRVEFERGEIDLMLIPEEFMSPQHPAELMFEEPHVVVGWKENPLIEDGLTADAFFAANHIGVTLGPSRGPSFTERNLAALGFERQVDVYAPYFSAVPWMLVGTNRLAVMQERLATAFKDVLPLEVVPMPVDFPSMRMVMQYHSARLGDEGQKWLRELIHDVASDELVNGEPIRLVNKIA